MISARFSMFLLIALCGQGKYFVCGTADWREPINLYLVVILPPAERKSSVIAWMVSPVEEYEREVNGELGAKMIESQMKLDAMEKEKRALVDKVSKGNATEEELHRKAAEIAAFQAVKPLRLTSKTERTLPNCCNGRGNVLSVLFVP